MNSNIYYVSNHEYKLVGTLYQFVLYLVKKFVFFQKVSSMRSLKLNLKLNLNIELFLDHYFDYF